MKYFDNGGKRAVWVVHRRAGKDNTLLNQIAKMSQRRVGTYWHMLPTNRQGRKVVWDGIDRHGRRIIDQAFPKAMREGKANSTEMKINLKNGSVIQIVGSDSYDSLVGSNPIHVTFSEWPLTKPSAWEFIRPILRENEGTAGFIYTPRGKNHGWKLLQVAKGNPAWFCQVQSILDTKALSLEDINEERQDGMPEELIQQEYYCSFEVSNAGSYYGAMIGELEAKELITTFPFSTDDVFTHWDIGFTDSTAIWFWKFRPDGGVDVIDCYEAHGLQVNHYVEVLHSKPYNYKYHFLPHDSNDARFKYATGLTIKEQLKAVLPNVKITPKLSKEDGIQAARVLLSPTNRTRIHKGNCKAGLEALEHYHREYNEDTRTYSKEPEHDWSSHYADAFRYLAVSVEAIRTLSKPLDEVAKRKVMTMNDLTLNDLVAIKRVSRV